MTSEKEKIEVMSEPPKGLGHFHCRTCGTGGLRGVERFVGICYNCNRQQHVKRNTSYDSPRYNFSDD